MKRISFSLIIGLLAAVNVISTFFTENISSKILFLEVNIWFYRFFWSVIAISLIFKHFEKSRNTPN
ncbi:hypothetical protein [Lacihabitans lacunae]|uniref:Uncharacterized protein n=1 Tax=Lacihabitans lacunae TaxID=1028214 RepID=A0ABV7YVD8_9BACT